VRECVKKGTEKVRERTSVSGMQPSSSNDVGQRKGKRKRRTEWRGKERIKDASWVAASLSLHVTAIVALGLEAHVWDGCKQYKTRRRARTN